MVLPTPEGPVSYAIDMSKWGGDFTREEATLAYLAGFDMCIPAAGPGGYGSMFKYQADDALEVGMKLGAYAFLEWGSNPRWWAAKTLESVGEFRSQVGYWALDLEDVDNPPPATLQERIDYADAFIDQLMEFGVAKSQIIIYTGGWYWVRESGFQNSDHFAKKGFGLWESYYDNNANRNGWAGCPWAWNQIYITQYGGTQYVGGQSVDVNAVYRLPNGDHSNTTEDDMTAIEELNRMKMAIFAGGERIRAGWSDQQRLEYANAIIDSCNDRSDNGWNAGQSLLDIATSAITLAQMDEEVDPVIGQGVSAEQLVQMLDAARAKAESFARP